MLVPGVKRSSLLQALSTVSCTRSSAVAGLREAQREGTQFGHQRDEFVPRRGGGRGLSHEVDPVPSGASADHADGPADHRRARHGIAGADSRRSVFRSRAAHLLGRRDRLRPAGRVVASETSLSWRRSAHGGLQPNAGGRLRFHSIALSQPPENRSLRMAILAVAGRAPEPQTRHSAKRAGKLWWWFAEQDRACRVIGKTAARCAAMPHTERMQDDSLSFSAGPRADGSRRLW